MILKRRQIILALAAGLVGSRSTFAQKSPGVRRVAVLFALTEDDALAQSYAAALRAGLREIGWREASNVQIDFRFAGGDAARVRAIAADVVKSSPEVIVSQSGLALDALLASTRTIPIVFTQVGDPLASGYVKSLAHPGGNVTGFAISEYSASGKMVEVLKDVAPATRVVGVVFNGRQRPQVGELRTIEATAKSIHVEVRPIDLGGDIDMLQAIEALAKIPHAGLVVFPNPIVNRNRHTIIERAAQLRLPAIYRYRHFVADGGLVSYGALPEDSFRSAASYVDRILRGEKPGDLPVQQPTRFVLILNLKTAKKLGLTISRDFLARVDEVIE